MAISIGFVDGLIKEYLLFRGYSTTYQAFKRERNLDVAYDLTVDTIVNQLFSHIRNQELEDLDELWTTLDVRLFSHLPSDFTEAIHSLETAIKRCFLITAVRARKMYVVLEFFQRYADYLTQPAEAKHWEGWFALPYVKDPSQHPAFQCYFTKKWMETFRLSLKNFLNTIFQQMPLPKLLAFHVAQLEHVSLREEITQLSAEIKALQTQLAQKSKTIQSLSILNQELLNQSSAQDSKRKAALNVLPSIKDESPSVSPSGQSPKNSNQDNEGVVGSGSADTTEKEAPVSQETFSGHTAPVTRCRFSSDGTLIASGSKDGTVRVWKLGSRSSRCATIFNAAPVCAVEWDCKSDKLLMFGTADSKIKIWNADSKKLVSQMDTPKQYPKILDLACSPAEPLLVCSSAEGASWRIKGLNTAFKRQKATKGMLASWNFNTGQWQAKFTIDPSPQIYSVMFNHNGNMLVTGGHDGMIRIFDMKTSSPIMGWPAHHGSVSSVQLSAGETSVLSMGSDGQVIEWSLHRIKKELQTFVLPQVSQNDGEMNLSHYDLAMDPAGKHFSVTYPGVPKMEHCAHVFSMTDGKHSQKLLGHAAPVVTTDWHPSFDRVATGSLDNTIKIHSLSLSNKPSES